MKHTHTEPDIPIVYEDDHVLVINKPVNVLSQKDRTGDPDVVSACKSYLQQSGSSSSYLGLIHRLDRPVGGLMLLAKTRAAANQLSQQMRDNFIQKTYWAVITGKAPQNGVLTHYLVKNERSNIVKAVSEDQKKAKRALLSFSKLDEAGSLQLLAIHLQTGRPHQIRVQLATEGYPIWGDYKYGLNQPDGREMALKAVELIFNHPIEKKEMRFKWPPDDVEPWNLFRNL